MTNESKQIQVIDVENSKLEIYGSRDVVRELQTRLMSFHPAAKEVGEKGMIAAAQLAVLMGASPLPGLNEIHIWYDAKRKQAMVAPGINYWRRKANEQGGMVWNARDEPRPMTEDERVAYGVPDNQLGAICRGVRLNDIRELKPLGFSIQDVFNTRIVTGIGTCGKSEYPKNGRPLLWTAIKRAETDFYKQAFPYTPGEPLRGGGGMVQVENGTYKPDYGPEWGNLDMSLRENELIVTGADSISTDDVIDALFEDDPSPAEEPATEPNGGTTETLPAFAVRFAKSHPYYSNNFHVVGTLTKIFGEDVGTQFATRPISEYEAALEKHAAENADKKAGG